MYSERSLGLKVHGARVDVRAASPLGAVGVPGSMSCPGVIQVADVCATSLAVEALVESLVG